MSAYLAIDDVPVRYGANEILKSLSLSVEAGTLVALLGSSGCGKTTLLRAISGFVQPNAGRILLAGRDITDTPPEKRNTAMVFQSYALWPHMTVFQNIAYGLKLRRRPRSEINARIDGLLSLLHLENLADRKATELSGGQRQRVALGRAIVREPQVFLFDEPLSNLDAKLRVQTRTELSKLHERLGTTFIYVTHDQIEAMTMATRIAVLKDGLLQQVGTPEDLYFGPENVFVGGFIGSPAMNFIPGGLAGTPEEMMLDTPPLRIALPAARSNRLAAHAGTEVTIGIRPEDMHSAADLPPEGKGYPFRAQVDVTEMMGNEKLLHLIVGTHRLLARVDPRTRATAGEEIQLTLDVDRLHIFDAKTQQALDKLEAPEEIAEADTVLPSIVPEEPAASG